MRQRSISSIGVVVVGLLPAILGGWVFGVVFTAIILVAFTEAMRIVQPGNAGFGLLGSAMLVVAGIAATQSGDPQIGSLLTALAVGLPLILCVLRPQTNPIERWSAAAVTTIYLGLPLVAALQLRNGTGYDAHDWLDSVAGIMPDVSDRTGGGLAWFLLALLVTWLSDTFAYLVGKSIGKHKLIPRVSPNKTIEGSLGGLAAAGITAILCNWIFGMDLALASAFGIGVLLGVVGQFGDLAESLLKRARGVKDSGNLIPGHGGMLDRIDALLFVLTATWLIAPVVAG